MACVVPGCKSHACTLKGKGGELSFHRFPSDLELKNEWIRNINKPQWEPTKFSRLCSLHFAPSCFRKGPQRKLLHSYAVPTIFPIQPIYTHKMQMLPMQVTNASAPHISTSTSKKTILSDTKLIKANETAEDQIIQDKGTEMLPLRGALSNPTNFTVTSSSSNNENKVQKGRIKEVSDGYYMKVKIKQLESRLAYYKELAERRGKKMRAAQRKCSRLTEKATSLECIINKLHSKMGCDVNPTVTNKEILDSDPQAKSNVRINRCSRAMKKIVIFTSSISPSKSTAVHRPPLTFG